MSRQPPFPAHLLPFPPLPDTQVLSSSTFKKPPLDGSLTLPEIYDWNYYNNGDHPVLLYPDGEGKLRTIHWSEAVRAVHKAARLIRLAVSGQGQVHAQRPIVGILAYLDAISFFVLIVGCMRADCVPFLISPRNPPVAIARLLVATQTTHIMVGVNNALGELASAALELLKQDQMPLPSRSLTPLFEDIFRHDLEETFEFLEAVSPDLSSHAVIYHSSGSTEFPKPIPLSHLNVLHCCIVPYFGELDLTGLRLCCHALPMFHGMGFAQTAWTASCGVIFAAAKPQSPALPPSSENVLRVAMATASDIVFTVPQHISAWSRNADELKYLSQIKALVYGGAPLDKGVGDAIVRAGVPLMTFYATMELGATSLFLPRDSGPDWEYFQINPQLRTRFIPNEFGHSELVALTSAHHTPFLVNGKCEDEDANFTNDLFISHPTRAGFWRMYGRTDDQLVTSNAMNTNPGPLENILTQDPSIQAAVIFGNGRSHIGVLVDPHPGHAFDPDDEESLERFREDIWPTIEKMNSVAATYSRLSKKMILSSKPEKPFQYTAKNTVRRQAVIRLYEDEIDALYGVVNMGAK